MKCQYCNNEVPNGTTKCPSCGATIEKQPMVQNVESTQYQSKPQGSDLNSTMQTMMQQQMMQQQMMMNQQMQKQMADMSKSSKSRATYMILGILLAGSGFNNFYIGRTAIGIIQLLLTFTVFGWFISGPWNFIESFIIDKDSNGKLLS